MKTQFYYVQTAFGGLKRASLLIVIGLSLAAAGGARADSAAELLERGIYTEETKGDLKAASFIYQQIVDDSTADRSLVAQAQLRLGICELKLGNKPLAISALDRLTQDFPDKSKLMLVVGNNMPRALDEMLRQIELNYIQEVDRTELTETAIRAIVGKLDSRSGLRTNDMALLGTNDMVHVAESLEQKIAGIGAMLKVDETNHEIIVETPLPNSPAFKGGLLAGDRIIKVNGAELPHEEELETAVKLLRGPPKTPVTVEVRRSGSEGLLSLLLVRDTVHVASVLGDHYKSDGTWEFMLDDRRKIGYVRLTQFGAQTAGEMVAALGALRTNGMKALILDLRDNPGGLLPVCVDVAGLFVPNGKMVVTVKGRSGEQEYDAKGDGAFLDFPMVILVNQTTASAAEILAACLQDQQRGVVVGERTYGQGLVRSLIELQGGLGALKLPVAAFFRPNGKPMNRYPSSKDTDDWGVKPDAGYEVSLTEDELKQHEKDQFEREKLDFTGTSRLEFQDRQLTQAVHCVVVQLAKQ